MCIFACYAFRFLFLLLSDQHTCYLFISLSVWLVFSLLLYMRSDIGSGFSGFNRINLAGLGGRSAMISLSGVDQGSIRVGRAFMILPTSGEPLLWQMTLAFIVSGTLVLLLQRPFQRVFRRRLPGLVLFLIWVGLNFAYWQYLGERAKALDILFLLSLPLLAVTD